MSGNSNVGNAAVYEAGDQRNYKDSEIRAEHEQNRFHEGQPNSHLALDSKDERSIANKLAQEEKREKDEEDSKNLDEASRLSQVDATLPAKAHGNEPSRGARIDQELREEEEEYLRRKGKFDDGMPGKK